MCCGIPGHRRLGYQLHQQSRKGRKNLWHISNRNYLTLMGAVQQLTEIRSPRSNGRRIAIMIIPSITFAADGPNAKAKETKIVDKDTNRAHGFNWRTLMTVNVRKK